MNRQLNWFFLLSLVFLTGCNEGEAPVSVRGKVSLDNKPLADGQISFVTLGKAPEVLQIRQGAFEGNVAPGKRVVEIRAYRAGETPPAPGPGAPKGPSLENYLPPQYNRDSKLSADVNPSGTNDFTFTLQSQDKEEANP